MIIKKDNSKINYLYHYTPKENVESILSSGVIKSKDQYTFFTNNYYKSISLFENEMMSNKFHITIDKVLKRRSYANPDNYRIIKIPYHNDGNFIKMIFDHQQKDSIYSISTIHKGNLYFDKDKIEVLEIPVQKRGLFLPKFISKLAFLMTTFINPILVKADTWLDSAEYYDISWWTGTEPNVLTVNTPEQLAGVLYLNKTYGNTFSNTYIKLQPNGEGCDMKSCYIDMSAHDWVPFTTGFHPIFNGKWKKSAAGLFSCGYHRILLKSINQKINLVENDYCTVSVFDTRPPSFILTKDDCSLVVTYNVYHSIHKTNATNGSFTVDKEIELKNKTVNVTTTPAAGYQLYNMTVKQKDGTDVNAFCNTNANTCSFTMPDDEVTVSVNFSKITYNIWIDNDTKKVTTTPKEVVEVEYGGEQTFTVTPKVDYDFVGYKLNDGGLIPVNGNQFTISNVKENMTIEIVTSPTKYKIENRNIANKYDFAVDHKFSTIKTVKICSSDSNCKTLKENEYTIDNQIINLKSSFINSMEEGNYELQVTFANQEEASSNFRLTHVTETPTIINNPKTKTNLLILFIIGLFIPVFMGFKKKREDSE